jgi:class 3 adenylate cyclase/tetratricopeptide (TPR) repeat protein
MPSCSHCGQDNPEGFRFCGSCGTALTAPARPAGTERKVVTVLFCDLVGFTARSDRADPEDVGALLRPYHQRLRAEVGRFEGTLDKFIGDAVMAVFGAPVAHEDDPERAVRCALGMLAAIEELNDADPGLDLAVRIGIASGEALVTLAPTAETEGVVGDVVNVASRLQGAAPVGRIVVEEATWRATRSLIDYQRLAPVRVKGKAEPVAIFRVTAARSRTGADAGRRPATPFVGRDHELGLLRRLYERVLGEHAVQLVTVVGEPGVGKSRLVGELAAFVDARPELVAWRQGRCLPYGEGITFWALGEVVKAQAGILESDGPDLVAAKLDAAVAALVEDRSTGEWLKARLAPLAGLVAAEAVGVARSESFSAWRQFIEAIAATRPLVLVIEDLHWADPALLQFLEHLLAEATEGDLLVVATARPELRERHPGWAGGWGNAAMLTLAPLSDAETARLVAALVGRSVLPAGLQALLLERAGGNPLYAEEFARLLGDRGLLAAGGDAPVRELPVPETLQALIAARLDALPPERKALLQDAAVVGKEFWSGTVAAMSGVGEGEVRAGLHELQRKELIRAAAASSVEHQAEYAFWHALVRDVAYSQIPRPGRARRHRAAAAWLQDLAGNRVADRAEVIAHHYTRALALTRASRGSPAEVAELEEPARRFLVLAGDQAVVLDVARAQAFYAQALALTPPGHPERARLLVKLARASSGDRPDEARPRYEAAIAAFEEAGDRLEAADTMVSLASLLWNMGDAAASRTLLRDAIELLEGEQAGRQLVHAYAELSVQKGDDGRYEEARAWAERGLALAGDGGFPEDRLLPLGFRGVARCSLGDPGGLDDLRETLQVALDAGLTYQTGLWYANLADKLGEFDPAGGLATFGDGIEFARRRGLTELAMWMRAATLERRFELGQWDELLREGAEVVAWYRAHGLETYTLLLAEVPMARVLLLRGRLAEAGELVERCLGVADAPYGDRLATLTLAAALGLARNQPAAAVERVEEFSRTTAGRSAWGRARCLPDLLRVCAATRQLPLARALLDGLPAGEATTEPDRHSLLAAAAVLAEAQGDLEGAAGGYRQAAEAWRAAGNPLERGQALFGLGRCLHRLDRPEATASLRGARAVFRDLGCRPLAADTDAWLPHAEAAGG